MQIVIAVVLAAHGIGHSLGLFPLVSLAPTSALPRWTGESWLMPGLAPLLARAIGGLAWLVAGIGFVLLAAVVMGWLADSWWQPLAVVASAISLLALVVFPAGFPTPVNLVGAAAVDLAVLVAVVWFGWSPDTLS